MVIGLLLMVSLIGLAVDARIIAGAPAWLKPVKFCLSTVIYLVSLAFMTRTLPQTRVLRWATTGTSVILTIEVAVILVQAARGTTSHFNVDTPLDASIFAGMGVGIMLVWLASIALLWQHWRTPHPDRALALAFRVGLLLHIVGASFGWMMTRPFPGQVDAITRGERPRIVGSHTVGGKDGGPGLPLTKWSTAYGDLRVPHFVGMHALQLLPLLLLGVRRVRRTRDDRTELTVLYAASGVYAVLVLLVLRQAVAGHPLLALPVT